MVSKHKPFIVVLSAGDEHGEKLVEALQDAGFKIQTLEKDSLALKFLERNNVHGIFIAGHTLEKTKELIVEIRKAESPVAIFCSLSLCNPENIAGLLDLGCDELFLKSFSSVEIVARIKAVLRRSSISKTRQVSANINLDTEKFNFHGVTVNPGQLEIIFSEKNKIKLGKKELGIIYYLANNPGVIISRGSLIHAVWGPHADTRSRSVDQYITKIRLLFEKHAEGLGCVRTLHGIGYWYDPKAQVKKKA